MSQHRRRFLHASGLVIAGALVGCSGGSGGSNGETTTEASATDEETTPEVTTDATTPEDTDTTTAAPTTGAASTTPATTAGENGSTARGTSAGGTSSGTTATGGGAGDQAAIEEWLANTSNYDGTVKDAIDQDSIEVMVGASGNGGTFAFAPPAIRVASGTTVTWAWTGNGTHNVVAKQGTFRSGDPQSGGDVTFEHTFEETGTFLYYCNPHRKFGMKGAVVVE